MTAPGTSTTTRTRTSTPRTELSEADLAALRSPAIDPAAVDASERQTPVTLFFLYLFVVVPFLALLLAIPMAWGGFMGPVDVGLLVFFYSLTALGITVGFHRHFTHGSFKANRPLRIALAIAGTWPSRVRSTAGSPTTASTTPSATKTATRTPRGGTATALPALMKGLFYAHMGWLFDVEQTPRAQVRAGPARRHGHAPGSPRAFPRVRLGLGAAAPRDRRPADLVMVGRRSPASSGARWSGSRWCTTSPGRSTRSATSWASSPFKSRDQSGNVWWLAIPSFGESWHNLHHADPTCARHGVEKGQIDISARLIRWFEKAGWAYDVRWPKTRTCSTAPPRTRDRP